MKLKTTDAGVCCKLGNCANSHKKCCKPYVRYEDKYVDCDFYEEKQQNKNIVNRILDAIFND